MGTTFSREDWVRRFLTEVCGDQREAWLRFALRHMPRRLQRQLDPEDVVQELALAALQHVDSFNGCGDQQARTRLRWRMRGLIRNLDRYYLRVKRTVLRDKVVTDTVEASTTTGDVTEQIAILDELELIVTTIPRLPPLEGQLVHLVVFKDVPLADAAIDVGLSRKSASQRLWRAKRLLQRMIGKGGRGMRGR